jgi:acetyltransferase
MQPPSLEHEWTAPDGTLVTIRPIRPEDREIEQAFVSGLSSNSKYSRFFSAINELSPRLLDQFTQVDFPHEMALIATIQTNMAEQEIGVARFAQGSSQGTAEFAVVVADSWQGRGLGRELLRHLFRVAEEVGLTQIEGIVLRTNKKMLRLCRELGFTVRQYPDDAELVCINKQL